VKEKLLVSGHYNIGILCLVVQINWQPCRNGPPRGRSKVGCLSIQGSITWRTTKERQIAKWVC
jgi:hypothetical protein